MAQPLTGPEQAQASIEALYRTHYRSLVRYGRRFSSDPSLCEDVAQETFLLLYRQLCRGKQIPNPEAWAALVMRRMLMRLARAGANHASLDHARCRVHQPPVPSYGSAVPGERFLRSLSPRESEVLLLRLQSLKYTEIATHLRISPSSVSTFLSRALVKVRRTVAANAVTHLVATDEFLINSPKNA